MVNVIDLARQDTELHRVSYREMAGPCPNPSCRCRRDGFHVDEQRNPWRRQDSETGQWVTEENKPPRGGFMCRGCWNSQELRPDGKRRGWGKPIDYLMHYRHLTYKQACAWIAEYEQRGSEQGSVPVGQATVQQPLARPASSPPPQQQEDWRSEQWQTKIDRLVTDGYFEMRDNPCNPAMEYLHKRGLYSNTIIITELGYSCDNGIPRLLIPTWVGGLYTAVSMRDLRPDVPYEQRWRDIPGGTKTQLYMGNCLIRPAITVLTESALDALSLLQETGGIYNVVATGGATCGQLAPWVARLQRMPQVFIAFDRDEQGDTQAQWWLKRLPNARRLTPTCHDINDMLVQGEDLWAWLLAALDRCVLCQRPLPESEPEGEAATAFFFDERGLLFCEEHWPHRLHRYPVVDLPGWERFADIPEWDDDEEISPFWDE